MNLQNQTGDVLSKLQSWVRHRVDIPTRLGLGPQGPRWSCPPPWLGLRALPWLCAWAPLGTPGNHSPMAHVLFRQLRRHCQLYLWRGGHLSPHCPRAAGAPPEAAEAHGKCGQQSLGGRQPRQRAQRSCRCQTLLGKGSELLCVTVGVVLPLCCTPAPRPLERWRTSVSDNGLA